MSKPYVSWLVGLLILLPLSGQAQQGAEPPHPDSLPYSESQFVSVKDVRLHYRSWPAPYHQQKGNILLIHGFCASTYSWRKVIHPLTRAGYNVVAVDLPGFGYSECPGHYTPTNTNNARLLWQFLHQIEQQNQRLQKGGWHLVGHSMGGGIASMMAQLQPQQSSTLIIVNGALYDNRDLTSYLFKVLFHIPPIGEIFQWASLHLFFNYSFFQKVIENSYGYAPDSTVVMNYLQPARDKETVRTIMKMISSYDQIDLQLQHIYTPTLLIWGENDELVTAREAKKLKKMMPNAQLHLMKDSKHCPMETDPGQFQQLLLTYLRQYNQIKIP